MAVVLAPFSISSCANSTWSAQANAAPISTAKDNDAHQHRHRHANACASMSVQVLLNVRAYATRSSTSAHNTHAAARALHLPPADGNMERRITSNVGNVHYFQLLLVLIQSIRFVCTQDWPSARVREGRGGAPRKIGTGSQAVGTSMQERSGAPIRSLATSTCVERCLFSLSDCGCPSAHQCSAAGTRTASISRERERHRALEGISREGACHANQVGPVHDL